MSKVKLNRIKAYNKIIIKAIPNQLLKLINKFRKRRIFKGIINIKVIKFITQALC